MTKLEQRIHSAVLKVHKDYLVMTGYWLSHAPESYITVIIAQEIVKLGYNVYIDTTLKKIRNDQSKNLNHTKRKLSPLLSKRPDISVVFKAKQQILAAIEVKRAAKFLNPVRRDTEKLEQLIGGEGGAKYGYVVEYSETKYHENRDTLKERFAGWATKTSWAVASSHISSLSGDEDRVWGFCILKRQRI